MISEILLDAKMDPTISIGGVLRDIGGNFRVGGRDYFVMEACEYTNSYHSFYPRVGIILNVEPDHLDFFKDIDDIRHSFHRYGENIPEDGVLIINRDIEGFEEVAGGLKCRIVTFGSDDSADYYAEDITYDEFARPSFYVCHKAKAGEGSLLAVVEPIMSQMLSLPIAAAQMSLG